MTHCSPVMFELDGSFLSRYFANDLVTKPQKRLAQQEGLVGPEKLVKSLRPLLLSGDGKEKVPMPVLDVQQEADATL